MDTLIKKITLADRWLPLVYLILIVGTGIVCWLAEKERIQQSDPRYSVECYVCIHQPAILIKP